VRKSIFTIIEKCDGCKRCETACVAEHQQSVSQRPRVTVEKAETFNYPSRCLHCVDAPCITACPTGAMQRDRAIDSVFSDDHRCIGCWMCVSVCPFGGVSTDLKTGKALKCDLCPDRVARGEDPACVVACPTGALLFLTPEDLAKRRRKSIALATTGRASVADLLEP
jgi:carbon-monoxide dehydrogenase iron sulfur subunit